MAAVLLVGFAAACTDRASHGEDQRARGLADSHEEQRWRDELDDQKSDRRAARERIDDLRDDWQQATAEPFGCGVPSHFPGAQCSIATVAAVIDGDTLRLRNGTLVRIVGIDAPEIHPRVECGGQEARRALELMLTGPPDDPRNPIRRLPTQVLLTRAELHPDRDGYGRLLRHVSAIVLDRTKSGFYNPESIDDLGQWLIIEGYARFDPYAYIHYATPQRDRDLLDVNYADDDQRAARRGAGIRSRCG